MSDKDRTEVDDFLALQSIAKTNKDTMIGGLGGGGGGERKREREKERERERGRK